MATEVKAYVPSYETVTVFHLRDLAAGTKTIIKSDKVKHLSVPHFEGLRIHNMLEFASQYP